MRNQSEYTVKLNNYTWTTLQMKNIIGMLKMDSVTESIMLFFQSDIFLFADSVQLKFYLV